MKPKSKIEKGKRFTNFVNDEIEKAGLGKAVPTPGSGSGDRFKGDSFNSLDFLLEYKNQKTIHLLNWVDQAKHQAEIGNYSPEKWALILKDPRSPETNPDCYAIVDLWEFLNLLKKSGEPLIKEPDKDMRYKIQRLIQSAKVVLKEL